MASSSPASWQSRFELSTCAAGELAASIPEKALGVAVVHSPAADDGDEAIHLVLESRAGSLRDLCAKRLQTAKLPPGAQLSVSFKLTPLADASPESVAAVCREQVILAGALRRELRPAMR